MSRRVSSGAGGGSGRDAPPQTYEGTYSGYGPTRADSIGAPVNMWAYQAASQTRAYNSKQATQTTPLGKVATP